VRLCPYYLNRWAKAEENINTKKRPNGGEK